MSRPLDVCFVLPSLAVGGAERVVVNLANGLLAAGHAPRLLLTDGEGPLRADLAVGVPITELGRPRVRRALPLVVRELRSTPTDVIVSTHTHVNLALAAVRPLLPSASRLVLREPTHTPESFDGRSTRWRRRAQRALYRRADLLIATSQLMAVDLRGLTGTHVALLHNPIDVDHVRAQAGGRQGSDESDPSTHGRIFVSVGRLSTQKSIPELLEVFAAGGAPNDRLVLIGDGPELDTVTERIQKLGLTERVSLEGALENPWQLVAQADRFVLASRHEGMPNAVLEALALGVPVLATSDLEVLDDLRRQSPSEAVVLVPRGGFGAELGRTHPLPPGERTLRASLLPPAYELRTVTAHLVELFLSLRGDETDDATGEHA